MVMEKKIGFVVEGDLDKVVVETIAHRLLDETFRAHAVRIGHRIAVRWVYSTVLALLEEKHYHHVILLLDADTSLDTEIERKERDIKAMFEEHHLDSDEVSVCFAVPEIEAWLLAEYEEHPEEIRDPKSRLVNHLGKRRPVPAVVIDLARTLDIAKARSRSPSFNAFVGTLERVAVSLSQAPAA
jgi:Domain of unknown function (DUF4276)